MRLKLGIRREPCDWPAALMASIPRLSRPFGLPDPRVLCNQERIAPDLFNLVVAKVGCISRRNDLLNKGNFNGLIEQ